MAKEKEFSILDDHENSWIDETRSGNEVVHVT